MSDDIETKTVFGLGQIDGVPLVILGIPAGAWEFIKNGNTNTFDFTKAGLNLKMAIYGAATHKETLELMQKVMNADFGNLPVKTDLKKDFSIEDPKSK
jgi:hypothetical protein